MLTRSVSHFCPDTYMGKLASRTAVTRLRTASHPAPAPGRLHGYTVFHDAPSPARSHSRQPVQVRAGCQNPPYIEIGPAV